MAAAEKIKDLIRSYAENDSERFYTIAMQIASSEARKGHTKVAQELKQLLEKSKEKSNLAIVNKAVQHPASHRFKEIEDLVEVVEHKTRLHNMVLHPEIREHIERIVVEQRKFDQLRHYNLWPRRKLLLTGPPGCGKTMTAEGLASELDLPLFTIRLDGLISRYMGETISKLKTVFDYMNSQRAVYLFDEFDSIGSNRHFGNEVGEIKRVLNSFLVYIEKDQSNSLVVAASNMQEHLDKALYRRFDDVIRYPLPEKDEIISLLRLHLSKNKEVREIDIENLSDTARGLSFADISRACDEAVKEKIIAEEAKISVQTIENFLKQRKAYS